MALRMAGLSRASDGRWFARGSREGLPHLGNIKSVWEPAAGSGKMARVLEAAGLRVLSTDILAGQDFLLAREQF